MHGRREKVVVITRGSDIDTLMHVGPQLRFGVGAVVNSQPVRRHSRPSRSAGRAISRISSACAER